MHARVRHSFPLLELVARGQRRREEENAHLESLPRSVHCHMRVVACHGQSAARVHRARHRRLDEKDAQIDRVTDRTHLVVRVLASSNGRLSSRVARQAVSQLSVCLHHRRTLIRSSQVQQQKIQFIIQKLKLNDSFDFFFFQVVCGFRS